MLAVTLDLSSSIGLAPRLDGGDAPVNVNASDDLAAYQSEMSLDINPTNPLHLAGFSHRRPPSPTNPSQPLHRTDIDLLQSYDGGKTWQRMTINNDNHENIPSLGPAEWRFDPSIAFDANGTLYIAYGHRKNVGNFGVDDLIVGRSADGGASFTFTIVDTASALFWDTLLDKWHLATGPDGTGSGNQAVYVAYTKVIPNQTTHIMVVGSNDGGLTFGSPVQVSDDTGPVSRIFADPAVGPNGEIYICWHDAHQGTLNFDCDFDGLFAPNHAFGTDIVVVDLERQFLTGDLESRVPAQPQRGIHTGPVLDVNRSGGIYNGRLYLTWVDTIDAADFLTTKNSDIYLAWSDNYGETWTLPSSIGNVESSTGTEFNPWVDVDQITGSVNVLYYTTDGDQATGNDDVHVRLASSIDGGASFEYATLSRQTSNEAQPLGYEGDYLEYIGLAVHGGAAHALWASRVPGGGVDLEAIYASASFYSAVGDNILTITGDDDDIVMDDLIIVARSALNADYLEVTINGMLQFATLAATVNVIHIDGRAGNDAVYIDANIDADFVIHGGIGNDSLTLFGRGASVLGNFEFFGDAGDDTFTIDFQQGDPLPRAGFEFNFIGGAGADDVFVIESDGTQRFTYFVNTLTDGADLDVEDWRADSSIDADDQTTLRAAVQQANWLGEKAYIFLPTGTNLLSIAGSNSDIDGDLDILGNVTIIGTGAGLSVIDATGLMDRIFQVATAEASLSLARLTLTGGSTWQDFSGGGAIHVDSGGVVDLNQVALVGNASNNSSGGAIRIVGEASKLTVRNSVFVNNTTQGLGGAIAIAPGGNNAPTVTIGASIFAKNSGLYSNVFIDGWPLPAGRFVNEGQNILDNNLGDYFSASAGDHIGTVDYVVTSVADTFDGSTDQVSMSLRDAIHLANTTAGAQEIWLPAWNFVLTRERDWLIHPTDMSVSIGDLDISESLTIRGINNSTSVAWRAGTAIDKVFELLGDYNLNGSVDAVDYIVWRRWDGRNVSYADGDDDGDTDQDDYDIWATNFGNTLTLLGVS